MLTRPLSSLTKTRHLLLSSASHLGSLQERFNLLFFGRVNILGGSVRGRARLVCAPSQQDLHALRVTLPDGRQQRCNAVLVLRLQSTRPRRVSAGMQLSMNKIITHVHVRALCNQILEHLALAEVGRIVDQVAAVYLRVNIIVLENQKELVGTGKNFALILLTLSSIHSFTWSRSPFFISHTGSLIFRLEIGLNWNFYGIIDR